MAGQVLPQLVGGAPRQPAGGPRGVDLTCLGGEGDGVQRLTVPERNGTAAVANRIRFVFSTTSTAGPMAGRFEGERFSGTFRVIPLAGDCVTAPVTRVMLQGEGRIHG